MPYDFVLIAGLVVALSPFLLPTNFLLSFTGLGNTQIRQPLPLAQFSAWGRAHSGDVFLSVCHSPINYTASGVTCKSVQTQCSLGSLCLLFR